MGRRNLCTILWIIYCLPHQISDDFSRSNRRSHGRRGWDDEKSGVEGDENCEYFISAQKESRSFPNSMNYAWDQFHASLIHPTDRQSSTTHENWWYVVYEEKKRSIKGGNLLPENFNSTFDFDWYIFSKFRHNTIGREESVHSDKIVQHPQAITWMSSG